MSKLSYLVQTHSAIVFVKLIKCEIESSVPKDFHSNASKMRNIHLRRKKDTYRQPTKRYHFTQLTRMCRIQKRNFFSFEYIYCSMEEAKAFLSTVETHVVHIGQWQLWMQRVGNVFALFFDTPEIFILLYGRPVYGFVYYDHWPSRQMLEQFIRSVRRFILYE